jgi:hypothetical protein
MEIENEKIHKQNCDVCSRTGWPETLPDGARGPASGVTREVPLHREPEFFPRAGGRNETRFLSPLACDFD